ncbi:MAG: pyrroline-5-carboxylate reductase [Brockia lithotrophica]|nr:pyrroline-5-carboxylate reductase [Brockia lithotrophica]
MAGLSSSPEAPAEVGFLGAGRIAEALIAGLVASGVAGESILVANRARAERLEELARRFGVRPVRNTSHLARAPLVVLAVKPKDVPEALAPLRELLGPAHVLVSLAAGVPLAALARLVPGAAIARAMPNTAAQVRASATGIAFPAGTPASVRKRVLELFVRVGSAVEVEERAMDAVTALAGSGPAFLYAALEAMIREAEKVLAPEDAVRLGRQMFAGAARLWEVDPAPLAEHIRRIASPGGTTERGLAVLQETGALSAFGRAVAAAAERAAEISQDVARSLGEETQSPP